MVHLNYQRLKKLKIIIIIIIIIIITTNDLVR